MNHDPAIIEAAERAIMIADVRLQTSAERIAGTVLAAVTPMIRAATLEEAAKVAEEHPEYPGEVGMGDQIAAAIRALKPPAESSAA